MREEIDIGQIVIQLHDMARKLENNKKHWVFGNDLRKLADRLSEVNKNYHMDTEHRFVWDYLRATNAMPLEDEE